MCEPVSIALSVASTVMGMAGQAHQGKTQSKYAQAQLNAEAQMAANQQSVANQQAQMEVQKGITERDKYMRQAKAKQSESASMMAASGFEMDSGSNLSMLSDKAEESQHEANLITQNAETNAWGHMVAANNISNQQSMLKAKHANAKKTDSFASGMDMGDSLLGGITKVKKIID